MRLILPIFCLDSENFESSTPDSSFLTPLNPSRTWRTERIREVSNNKENSNLRLARTETRRRHANSWVGSSHENIRAGNDVRRTGYDTWRGEPGSRRIELKGEERLIKEPTDSDFEEFNISRNESQRIFLFKFNPECFLFCQHYLVPGFGPEVE